MGLERRRIDVKGLKDAYRQIWWDMPIQLQMPLKESSYFKKKNTEKKFEKLLDEVVAIINNFPEAEDERVKWKEDSQKKLDDLMASIEGFELGVIDQRMKEQFMNTTREFISECKTFDSKISYGDIGQAMRNVWIISILQKSFGKNIEFNMASFGYSMLYPYSDNYLDDPKVPIDEKLDFNKRFYRRLLGEKLEQRSIHEGQVFDLVGKIEEVYDRETYSKVFESLLIIFEGQRKSLIQQEGISNPYERDMLDISIEKGGASVLADGYLIDGFLSEEEEFFTYGYGFLLQLCDDLQDVKEDYDNEHMTVMSQLAGKYNLDNIVTKLINLTVHIIKETECFKGDNIDEIKKLIIDNCTLMIIFAVAMGKNYFSKEYVKEIAKYLPFTLGYIEKMKGKLQIKFSSVEKSYYGVDIEDIIYYLVM